MEENWLKPTLLLFINVIFMAGTVLCQNNDGPIGAHRVYRKTQFSCHGRSNGYYADIETGCQVYHMCDGLGRQFSYSCPNTTLFQQRMLICDHWYMVNCSRAESDYDANLLIGQKDKPFVPDDEQHLRTPRPDLLDRPYAPDYSGESYRNQYEVPQDLNHIDDSNQLVETVANNKFKLNPPPSSTRWKIPVPSREILPPAPSPIAIRRMDEIEDEIPDLGTSFSSHYNTSSDIKSEEYKSNFISKPTTTLATTQFKTTSSNIAKTFSTKPSTNNPTTTTIDFKSKILKSSTTTERTVSIITKQPFSNSISGNKIKVPSKLYEPPFLYPIWNENYTKTLEEKNEDKKLTKIITSTTRSPLRIISTSASFVTLPSVGKTLSPIPRPFTRPTTSSGKPFSKKYYSTTTSNYNTIEDKDSFESLQQSESSNRGPASINNYDFTRISAKSSTFNYNTKGSTQQLNERKTLNTQLLKQKPIVVVSQPNEDISSSNEQENLPESILDYNIPKGEKLNTPIPFSKLNKNRIETEKPIKTSNISPNNVQIPPLDLVPPFPEYVQHDVATTQGPPIYFEWKVPSNALEPPKLDPPIGVNGRLPDYSKVFHNQNDAASDRPQLIKQQLPHEQQQFPLENESTTFALDDSQILQDSQLDQGSFGKKLQTTGSPPELPTINLQPPYTDQQEFTSENSTDNNIKAFPFSHNPFLSTLATKSQRSVNSSTKTPTSSPRPFSSSNKRELITEKQSMKPPATEQQIQQLKRQLSIPEFAFPLESGRTGYDFNESKNSFQLKIPKQKNDNKSKWYGENSQCPECHPSFVRPGSCEPCIKSR